MFTVQSGREYSSIEGERTKRGLVTMDVLLDENELYTRSKAKDETSKAITKVSFKDLTIRQYDPVFAKCGQYDSPPLCLGNCNNVSAIIGKTPFDYLRTHYFMGIVDKDYSGNKMDSAMTVYIQGAFTFTSEFPIQANTQLCCVPSFKYTKTKLIDNVYHIDLSKWDTESQEKIGFKFVPVQTFRNAVHDYTTKILKNTKMTFVSITLGNETVDEIEKKIESAININFPDYKDTTSIQYAIIAKWVYLVLYYKNNSIDVAKPTEYEKILNEEKLDKTMFVDKLYFLKRKYERIIDGYVNQQVVAKSLTGTSKGKVYALLLQK